MNGSRKFGWTRRGFAVATILCLISLALFPVTSGSFSAVYGPASADRAHRGAVALHGMVADGIAGQGKGMQTSVPLADFAANFIVHNFAQTLQSWSSSITRSTAPRAPDFFTPILC